MRLASLLILALALVAGCTSSKDLTNAEKALLITESDFIDYGLKAEKTPRGEFGKTVDWVNRATQYTYTTPENGDFYVYCTVSIERSAANALTGHTANKAGLKIGFLSSGVTEKVIELARPFGSQSSLTLLLKDGKPIGNTFTALIGKTSVLLVYSGIYFETEDDFREFIEDKIKQYRS